MKNKKDIPWVDLFIGLVKAIKEVGVANWFGWRRRQESLNQTQVEFNEQVEKEIDELREIVKAIQK